RTRSASDTTGLKWAPETVPKARIRATSPAPVAIEFSRSSRPASPGLSRWAKMPEPTTVATRKAVPSASEVALRAWSRFIRSAAAGGGFRCGGAAHRIHARLDRPEDAGRHLDVAEDGVDLPRLAVRGVNPDLVLHGVAARDLILSGGGEALIAETGLR